MKKIALVPARTLSVYGGGDISPVEPIYTQATTSKNSHTILGGIKYEF